MPAKDDPVVIKKYANRRLYNTGTSTYVTLEDLAEMVKRGEDFAVQDAKSGEDITHPVLTQIIFELENKEGQNMLPVSFLRQLISFYGDQMQMVVPSFLEQSMIAFAKEQGLRIAPQSTGHNPRPLELEDTLLLRTTDMRGVRPGAWSWYDRVAPVARVGRSIYVFDVSADDARAAAGAR